MEHNKTFIDDLKLWRAERGITGYSLETHVRCIAEELFELMHYNDEECKSNVEQFMEYFYRKPAEINMNTVIDASCDMTVFNTNFTEQAGYSARLAMDETILEISSRTGATNPETGKWEKFKTPEAMAKWYTADYNKAYLGD